MTKTEILQAIEDRITAQWEEGSITPVILGEILAETIEWLDARSANQILSGSGAPSSSLGNNGDFYVDLAGVFYGPKTSGSWGAGVGLIGESITPEWVVKAGGYRKDSRVRNSNYEEFLSLENNNTAPLSDNTKWKSAGKNYDSVLGTATQSNSVVPFIPMNPVGATVSNTATVGNFIYANHALLNGKYIDSVDILVNTPGTLTINRVKNAGNSSFEIVESIVLNLEADKTRYYIGKQLASDETLSVGAVTDTGKFVYSTTLGPNPVGGIFRQRNHSTGVWANSSGTTDLNIGFNVIAPKEVSNVLNALKDKVAELEKHAGSLEGKKVGIVGDSISTYTGYIYGGNSSYYPTNNVQSVMLTWWWLFKQSTKANLVLLDAWSGSRVVASSSGNLPTRLGRPTADLDYLFFFMGTNDLGNNAALGDIDTETEFTLTQFTDSYNNALVTWLNALPDTKIIAFTLLPRFTGEALYTNTNGLTYVDFSNRIKELCSLYHVPYIDLSGIGLTTGNHTTYLTDGLHPNAAGMELLAKYILTHLPKVAKVERDKYIRVWDGTDKDNGLTYPAKRLYSNTLYTAKRGVTIYKTELPGISPKWEITIQSGDNGFINHLGKNTTPIVTSVIEAGTFTAEYYNKTTGSTRVRLKLPIFKPNLVYIQVTGPTGSYQWSVKQYDHVSNQVKDSGWLDPGKIYLMDRNSDFASLVFRKTTDANVSVAEVNAAGLTLHTYYDMEPKQDAFTQVIDNLVQGTINAVGSVGTSTTRVRTNQLISTLSRAKELELTVAGFGFWLYKYYPDGTYVENTKYVGPAKVKLVQGYLYRFNVTVEPDTGVTLTPAEVNGKFKISTTSTVKQVAEYKTMLYSIFSQGGWGTAMIKVSSTNGAYLTRLGTKDKLKPLSLEANKLITVYGPTSGFEVGVLRKTSDGTIVDSGWQKFPYSFSLQGYVEYTISITKDPSGNISMEDINTPEFYLVEPFTNTELATAIRNSLSGTTEDVGLTPSESSRIVRSPFAPVQIIAHRGFHELAPENSLDAYEHAGRMGFEMAECDFAPTSDGELILMHDTTINRTMRNAADYSEIATSINPSTKTLAELRSNYVLASDNPKYRRPVPTLEEFFIMCRDWGLYPLPEIKTGTNTDVTKAYEIGCKIMGKDNFAFCSSSNSLLDHARSLSENIPLYYIGGSILGTSHGTTGKSRENPNNVWYAAATNVTKELTDAYHAKGMKVGVWTISPASFESEYEKGVDIIAGDRLGANIKNPKVLLSSDNTFTDFTHNGTVTNNKLILTNGKVLSWTESQAIMLGNIFVRIRFKGALTVATPNLADSVTSEGFTTKTWQVAIDNKIPSLTITSSSNDTEIEEIYYKYNKC